MSTINGIFQRRGIAFPLAAFYASKKALENTGREKSRQWITPSVGFGHQRMSLLPEDNVESLPFYDAEARLAITSDARIDNRPELFDALDVGKIERKNFSDSRIILRAWRKWGHDCPLYLVGDYAFAIWDEQARTLFCARDHVGAKPFYYNLTSDYFIFASEISSLLAIPEISSELDEDFVLASLADKRFYLPDRTYYSAIRRLAPGHTLTVTAQTKRLSQYWFPENSKAVRSTKDEDYAETAREILTRAVSDRLRTKENVGVHLSGGLDSSSLTVLAARERRKQGLAPPKVFSWQPLPNETDSVLVREYAQIQAICDQENLTPIFCPMNAADILTILKKDPVREPIHITLPIETTIQKRAAQEDVRLILSGWGGDEVLSFDGRGFYAELLLHGRWWRLLREGRKHGSALKFISKELLLLMFTDRIEGFKKLKAHSLRVNHFTTSFLRPELKNRVRLRKAFCRQASTRSTLFWLWTCGMLAYRMESWAAHAAPLKIEYAYPLSDRRLMEFVAGLPSEQFVRGKWKRWIMRSAMDGILPKSVCWQPDKAEPVRAEKGLTEVYLALAMAREEILAAHELPSRAHYFDMERLMEKLSPESLKDRPKQADIMRAVQFLDF